MLVRDLMSSPPVVCGAEDTLADAAGTMRAAEIGSIVVVDEGKVAGILTERDLLRAAAAGADPSSDRVRLWMTANPDVLGPEEDAGAAWTSLSHHHYRHLPVVDGDTLDGVVSMRDLFGAASLRPAGPGRRRRGDDHDRRRPRARGLLPLPPVLGRRLGRRPQLRGRLVPPLL